MSEDKVELIGVRKKCRDVLLNTKANRIISRIDRAIEIGDHAFVKKLMFYLARERKEPSNTRSWRWREFNGIPIGNMFFETLDSINLTTFDAIYGLVKDDRVNLLHTDIFIFEDLTLLQKRALGKMFSMLRFVQVSSSPVGKRTWIRLKVSGDLATEVQELVDEIQASLGVIAEDSRIETSFDNIL